MKRIDFLNRYCATDNNGYIHLKIEKEKCLFLDDNEKCMIYESRPMQCRTWPFWTENLKTKDKYIKSVLSFCKGAAQGKLYSFKEIEHIAKETDNWYDD